jgi:hypothetical protein
MISILEDVCLGTPRSAVNAWLSLHLSNQHDFRGTAGAVGEENESVVGVNVI